MARRKQAPKDLTGIRSRGGTYQVRLFGGQDPVTGKQLMLTGSAEDDSAIKLRDKVRRPPEVPTEADAWSQTAALSPSDLHRTRVHPEPAPRHYELAVDLR